MTSPVTDEPNAEDRPPAPNSGGVRLRWVLWLLGLLAAMPVVVTLIGAATSPPHAAGVPVGHLIYLDADQPSEKTTILRGLYITQPGGTPRLLVHENEPQDSDAGIREWITEPAASPDGTQVAYIQQNITLLEETHTQVTQLWVMPLKLPDAKPRLLLDLTKLHLKQIVGLAWSLDGRSVLFLQDNRQYSVPVQGKPTTLFSGSPLMSFNPLIINPDLSATTSLALRPGGVFAYQTSTTNGEQVIAGTYHAFGQYGTSVWALGPNRQIAFVEKTKPYQICVQDLEPSAQERFYKAKWGWSLFGRRHITSLHWSPDGKYLGFTVSKPPVPEDELFYLDLADGKTYQLPVRTGRAAWDWTR